MNPKNPFQELYKVARVKYLIQLVQQVESIETIVGLIRNQRMYEFFKKCIYSKREIQVGHYMTVTHLKKTIKLS